MIILLSSLGFLVFHTQPEEAYVEAWENLSTVLQMAAEYWYAFPLVYGLPALALLLARQGEAERAVELYEVASRYPLEPSSRWFASIAGASIKAAAANLPAEAVAKAKARGRARDLQATPL